jgi:hypothetical protein
VSSIAYLAVAGVVCALLVLGIVTATSRRRKCDSGQSTALEPRGVGSRLATTDEDLDWRVAVPEGTLSLESIIEVFPGEEGLDPSSALVMPQEGDEALVIGDEKQAREIGVVLGVAGEQVVSSTRRASAGTEAVIAVQQRFGYLVKLHPEDLAAMKANKLLEVKKADGYVRGVVRGNDGKFVNLARIKNVSKMQAVASGAAILSALAMQAQLDRIEKALAEVQSSIEEVQVELEDQHRSSSRGAAELLGETYRAARNTGQLTQAQWDQLAPMAHTVYALRQQSLARLQRVVEQVETLQGKAKDRRKQLQFFEDRISGLVSGLDAADRVTAQFQILRLWHMSCSGDPALEQTNRETRNHMDTRSAQRAGALDALAKAFDDPDVTRRLQKWHVMHRRKIRATGKNLSQKVSDAAAIGLSAEPKSGEGSNTVRSSDA